MREFAADFGDRCVFSDLGGDVLEVEVDFGFRLGSSRCLVLAERSAWDRPGVHGEEPARSTADKSAQMMIWKVKRRKREGSTEERRERKNPKGGRLLLQISTDIHAFELNKK